MFEWLNYKQRLIKVRAELVKGKKAMEAIADKGNIGKDVREVARCQARLCDVLIRVIDTLPGKGIAQVADGEPGNNDT